MQLYQDTSVSEIDQVPKRCWMTMMMTMAMIISSSKHLAQLKFFHHNIFLRTMSPAPR